jgi:hypothetical protein
MAEIHMHTCNNLENSTIFIEYGLSNQLYEKLKSETQKNGFLKLIIFTIIPSILADEPVNVIISSPPSSSSSLYPQIYSFLFLNEFCLTHADFPLSSVNILQQLLETYLPGSLVQFVQSLSSINHISQIINGEASSARA